MEAAGDSPQRREATNFFMQARAALKQNQTGLAEKYLRRALALWPDNYNYNLQLAKLAIQIGKSEMEIEALLQQTSCLNLAATEPRLLLATQYEKQNCLQQAVAIYKGVLNIDPSNIIVRRKLGQLNVDFGQTMGITTLSMRIMESTPEPEALAEPEPHTETVMEPALEEEAVMPAGTIDGYTTPVARSALNAITESLHGYASENADAQLNKVVSESTEHWDSLMEALQHDSEMFEIDGQMPLNVGVSYMEMGLFEDAAEEFQEAYRLFASKGDDQALHCCRLLIDCLQQLQRFEEAGEWCRRALELTGNQGEESAAFRYELATIYERLGESQRAAQLLSELEPNANVEAPIEMPRSTASLPKLEAARIRTFALRPSRGISGEDFVFDERQEELTIGRAAKNDFHVDSPRVSKEHARMRFTAQGLVLINLSTTNGTFLNGVRLEPGREYPLQPGDQIGLGKTIDLDLIELDQ